MMPFGPHYPLVLRPVMRHAERLSEVLALRERASSPDDAGHYWLVGRADELRCVAAVLAADWRYGRLSAEVAAVELARHLRILHAGLAAHVGLSAPSCCRAPLDPSPARQAAADASPR